ncbi:MAG: hypothetical protein QMD71_07725 [bacterium]|nr:hypothetical protein [bacterium]
MNIIIFLINFNYSIGFGYGYYAPSIEQLNLWLVRNRVSAISPSVIIGTDARITMNPFYMDAGIDYFKAKTADGSRSLTVIPIGVSLSYKLWILPALLSFNSGAGYERYFTQYSENNGFRASGWGNGMPVKIGLNFIVVRDVSLDLLLGYKFANVSKLKTKDGFLTDTDYSIMTIKLWGPFLKFNFRREFF